MADSHVWTKGEKVGVMPPGGFEKLWLEGDPHITSITQVQQAGLVTRWYVQATFNGNNTLIGRDGQPLHWATPDEAQAYLDKMVGGYQVIRMAREKGLEMYWDVEVWGNFQFVSSVAGVPSRYAANNVKAPDPKTAVLDTIGIQWKPCRVDSTITRDNGDTFQLIVPISGNHLGVLYVPGRGLNHYATPVDEERLLWLNGFTTPLD